MREVKGIMIHCEADLTDVAELKPYPENNKTHGENQLRILAKAIKAQGWRVPITVSKQSGYIVRGHGRLEAAKRLGMDKVPVEYQDYACTESERMDRLADNVLTELAEWNLPAIKNELEELDSGNLDMELTGYDDEARERLMTQFHTDEEPTDAEAQIDKAAELNKVWKVKTGDLWQVGAHRLLCGDSTKAADVGRVLGDSKPFLMVTDPPYGVEYSAGWRDNALGGKEGGRATGKVANDDRADWREAYMLFPGDVVYVWHADVASPVVADSLTACGFERRALIIWAKSVMVIGRGDYHHQHEPCWYCVRKGKPGLRTDDRKQTTLWQIDKPQKSETGHSTQKPLECMARPMRNHDAPEVYDPFLGSGTTMVATQNTDRKCYGIEISCDCCAVILQRMSDAFPDLEIKKHG